MKTTLAIVLSVAFACMIAADADACFKHGNSKWALHFAGEHNSKTNTCEYTVTDCTAGAGQVVTAGTPGPGRFDVYVLALDTNGIAGTRYGISCLGNFYFYGWTKCSDFEIPTAGWPGCDEGNAQTWTVEQPPGHVTLGILDVYVYAQAQAVLSAADDPRKGFAEWCDGASPEPWCCQIPKSTYVAAFGCLGFGCAGYNPCGLVATEKSSWGAVKAIYKEEFNTSGTSN
jgi:hypothetical protein